MKYELTFRIWEKIPYSFTVNGKEWNTSTIDEQISIIEFHTVDHRENYSEFERSLAAKERQVEETIVASNPNIVLVGIKYYTPIYEQF